MAASESYIRRLAPAYRPHLHGLFFSNIMKFAISSLALLAVSHTLPTEPLTVPGSKHEGQSFLIAKPQLPMALTNNKKYDDTLASSKQDQQLLQMPKKEQLAEKIEDILDLPLFFKKVVDSDKLQESICEDALRERAEHLYAIAMDSKKEFDHPTRVIGSKGHWGTVNYVLGELDKLSEYYTYDVQNFDAIDGRVKSFSLLIEGVEPKLVSALSLTPPTPNGKPVHGNLALVSDNGCDPLDYPKNFTKGDIALVRRGVCPFSEKLKVAGRMGAAGLIIYDEDAPLHGTLGEPTGKEVPTVAISKKDAQKYIDTLTKKPEHRFPTTLYIDSYVRKIQTVNVIAETKGGDHKNVVCLGAHSDSVTEGPGINDDGSGTISLLEVAKQLTNFKVNNAVRFAWWAAEEEGLLGSYAYTANLLPLENQKLRVFMDYDMMASPNYEFQVYDANNKDHPNGSGDLKNLYVKWYQAHNLNYTFVPFDGRSDYVGFIDAGIPAGGIATGAEGVKDKKGVEKFGGKEGKWFDPCYHQLCDNLSNLDYKAWVINTKLIAHTVATYAKSFEGFPQREFAASTDGKHKYSDMFKYRGSHLVV